MSLEVFTNYVDQHKRFKGSGDFRADANALNHFFMDWLPLWIEENPENALATVLITPGYPIEKVKEALHSRLNRNPMVI